MTDRDMSDWQAGVIEGIEIGQHNAAVAAAEAVPPRTDAQIVAQTEELARLLMLEFYSREAPASTQFRDAEDPRGRHVWKIACQAQEILTATDPENAATEVDDVPTDAVPQPAGEYPLPPLVGTLAALPPTTRSVVEAYGAACARVAVDADRKARAAAQATPAISGYTCTVPDDCETLHWRGQILSMNELASVAQPAVGEEIHVHIEGKDVLTLPLASSGMGATRFVVHVPAQPSASAEPVAWAAVHFGGRRDGKIYTTCDTRKQIEAYIQDVHRSSDSLTLRARPLAFADAPVAAQAQQPVSGADELVRTDLDAPCPHCSAGPRYYCGHLLSAAPQESAIDQFDLHRAGSALSPAAREQIIGSALYASINEMMATLGRDGEIDTRHPAVEAVMDALHEIDGGAPRAQSDAPSDEDIISLAITEALLYQSAFGDYECGYREDADTSSYVLSFARALLARYGRTQADAGKRDAARYRWLRENGDQMIGRDRGAGPEWTYGEELDEAVDTAIAAQKGGAA